MTDTEIANELRQLREWLSTVTHQAPMLVQPEPRPLAAHQAGLEALARAVALLEQPAEEAPPEGEATELEWLHWFCVNADFGPGDGDEQIRLRRAFERQTGKRVPKGWRYEDDEDDTSDEEEG